MALIAGLVENSWNNQPAASSTSKMVSSGLYSSHSPGRVRGGSFGELKLGSDAVVVFGLLLVLFVGEVVVESAGRFERVEFVLPAGLALLPAHVVAELVVEFGGVVAGIGNGRVFHNGIG